MRNLGVFSLVFPGNCYIASRLMRNLGGFSLIFPGNCYIASRPMRNLGGFSLVFPGNCYITSRPMRNLICSLLSKQVFIISLVYLEGSISIFHIYFAMAPFCPIRQPDDPGFASATIDRIVLSAFLLYAAGIRPYGAFPSRNL